MLIIARSPHLAYPVTGPGTRFEELGIIPYSPYSSTLNLVHLKRGSWNPDYFPRQRWGTLVQAVLNNIDLAIRDGRRRPWNSGRNGWVFDGLDGLCIGAFSQIIWV